MTERRAFEVAVNILEENRERLKSELQEAVTQEDWVVAFNVASELRVLDANLIMGNKVLEKLPG